MSAISRLLTPDTVSLTAQATTKEVLFQVAADALSSRVGINSTQIREALLMREQLGSTGLGQGVGIPHGRLKGLKQVAGMFFRLSTPIPFDAPDNRPVDLIFFLLVPEQSTEEHLQLLSELAQGFSDPDFRESLRKAANADDIILTFTNNGQ
ncbi:MAG: IIA-like nitrogen-regulatory protein PtsN [Pseudomonadota bacterium]|jgi:PTS system nitrogen regulatory IIA component